MKKIVIEIDDDLYNEILSRKYSKTRLEKAVANGTVLPEHHGRLISEEDMLSVIIFSKLFDNAKVGEVKEALLNIPTIIEADKCTYKETGCGSCKRQLDCPIEAEESDSKCRE